ncbi:FAD:protein FMN transferase [Hymenobacter chitinivorans]|uniref:FAD:protein FMN transferase n=1 Tax=Hymenobacter chitinivorans DSM 11115 TaxID=1121954 RepID=A0A2M9BQN3_9BACT|nr:FAD:protein FMN transferase [Hymenobacter chitinivorans]PJJ60238.1 thiamine biosynthesis lipoprotein [Hymenobacter chitinivorans DSM 11115]
MTRCWKAVLLLLLWPAGLLAAPRPVRNFTKSAHLMGSHFEFTVVSSHDTLAWQALEAAVSEVRRIDHLMSFWDSTSQITQINRQAGRQPVQVDQEVFDLIQRTLRISELSGGAFDVTFASADKIYKFDRQAHAALPDPAVVKASVARINYRNILLDPARRTVLLREPGMRLNLAGVLQGYGVRRAKALLEARGLKGGLLNGSGDVLCWGRQADGSLWRVAIGDPKHPGSVASWVSLTDMAVVTAGNYEQFFTVQGQVYGHIINPHTGYPATGLRSVTILCPDVELADCLDEVVFVLGPEAGLAFVNRLKDVSCVLITDDNRTLTSKGLQLNYYRNNDPSQPVPAPDSAPKP